MQTRKTQCKKLCEMYKDILETLYETHSVHRAVDYAVLFSLNHFVTYDSESHQCLDMQLQFYNRQGITVILDIPNHTIFGFVDELKYVEFFINEEIAGAIYSTTLNFAEFLRERDHLITVAQCDQTYTVDLHK